MPSKHPRSYSLETRGIGSSQGADDKPHYSNSDTEDNNRQCNCPWSINGDNGLIRIIQSRWYDQIIFMHNFETGAPVNDY
jgi:hypothetical protein